MIDILLFYTVHAPKKVNENHIQRDEYVQVILIEIAVQPVCG